MLNLVITSTDKKFIREFRKRYEKIINKSMTIKFEKKVNNGNLDQELAAVKDGETETQAGRIQLLDLFGPDFILNFLSVGLKVI